MALIDTTGLRRSPPVTSTIPRFARTRPSSTVASSSRPTESSSGSRLAQANVEHGEVKELPDFSIAIPSFSDPDGIHLELSAAL